MSEPSEPISELRALNRRKKKSEDVESSDEDDSDDDSGKDFPDIVHGSNVCESDWVVGDSGDCNQCGLVLTLDDCLSRALGDLMLCEGCFDVYMGLAEPVD